LEKAGRYDEACLAYARALRKRPGRAKWWYRLGRARWKAGDLVGASRAYERAIELDPDRGLWRQRWERSRTQSSRLPQFQGLLVAHRAHHRGLPENSLEGTAMLPEWVDGVEIDVRLTSDGVPVLIHDNTVDRTTAITGRVSEFTSRRISTATAGRVPDLQSYLSSPHLDRFSLVMVDLKVPAGPHLLRVLDSIREVCATERIIAMVRTLEQLSALRSTRDAYRVGWYGTTTSDVRQRLRVAENFDIELLMIARGSNRYLRNRAAGQSIRGAGRLVGASTVNTDTAIDSVANDGCDVLLTDVSHWHRFAPG
jgi:glycerophosphoryl diester phosphodiesterase